MRSVERGTTDSDAEFYDAPVRVGHTQMLLDPQHVNKFGERLADLFNAIGGIAIWVNSISAGDPLLATRLGGHISGFAELTDQVNRILAQGGSTREAISECRKALTELTNAIELELRGGN